MITSALILLLALSSGALHGQVADSGASAAVRQVVQRGLHPDMRWARLADVRHTLRVVYDTSAIGAQLLWVHETRDATGTLRYDVTPQGRGMLAVLHDAGSYGLLPADFDAARLASMTTSLADPAQRGAFDVALTANAARFVRTIREGHVEPHTMHPGLAMRRDRLAPAELADAVRTLAAGSDMPTVIALHEPSLLHYTATKRALGALRTRMMSDSLANGPRVPLPRLDARRSVRAGDEWSGVPALQRLLVLYGETLGPTEGEAVSADSLRMTGPLADALRRVQERLALEADGVLGRATFEALSTPLETRARALALALERWRWLPRTFTHPPIMVNVPAFRFYAFSSASADEASLLSMRIVAGEANKTETPMFTATLSTVVFSPYWDVPKSIAFKELLPKAWRDPEYLARNHYEIVPQGSGDEGRNMGTGPSAVAAVAAGRARIRQTPGPHNALRHVKFLFPNPYNVYFHDTPSQRTFERVRRDESHGCIRLQHPVALAELLLQDQPEWTPERMAEAMQRESPLYVQILRPRPVYILYATAMVAEDGTTHFFPDLYQHDEKLVMALRKGFPYRTESAPRGGTP
jgi:murein L,D-transpeptidase YcbB/YkuD